MHSVRFERAEPDRLAIVERAIDYHIRPGFERFSNEAELAQIEMDAMCAAPSPAALDIARRRFAALVSALLPRAAEALGRSEHVFAAPCRRPDGSYAVAVAGSNGEILHIADLPSRGHDVTFDPVSGKAVVFARRPGTFALVFYITGAGEPQTITSPPGHHFYGHGVFSADGRLLYAAENAFETATGKIGIYDCTDGFRRKGALASHGIGPHEVLLMPDNRTLVVANGGIETHLGYGRQKLNIPLMKPSLAYLDTATGDLIDQVVLPQALHKLSIRHLCVDGGGAVWFGCQYEGGSGDDVPLLGRHRPGAEPELFGAEGGLCQSMKHYVGSVAANADGSLVAATSPRGGVAIMLEADSGRIVSSRNLPEVCGAAADGAGFVHSTHRGLLDIQGHAVSSQTIAAWDNHLLRI